MKSDNPYRGVIVPMVTPLTEAHAIDREGVTRLAGLLAGAGASLFAGGTTGEGASLSLAQKEELTGLTVRAVNGRTLVYAGISGNSFPESVDAARRFAGAGADAVVANVPFCYPLNGNYTLRYFEELAEACPIPLIIYNIPGTTHYSIPLHILDRLSHHPNIAGVKDSERDQNRLDQALALWRDRCDFAHLTGWAAMSVYALQNGSDGIVPSTGNFDPGSYVAMYSAVLHGDNTMAGELQKRTNRLSALYQSNRNLSESLVALKVILSVLGICGTFMMPPVYPMEDEEEISYRKTIERELEKLR
ncbi:MAG: dihydrodipicolinate synthase family protein [Prolixibacteraceae bacterium]